MKKELKLNNKILLVACWLDQGNFTRWKPHYVRHLDKFMIKYESKLA